MSAGGYRKSVERVWLVEVNDRRFSDGWYPFSVHLDKEAAEDTATAFRYQNNDPNYARVVELKVMKHGSN